jgi:AcrR family transcriptional regulator
VLREATRMVGVVPNAAYRHFADRDELLAAVCAAAMGELADRMAQGDPRNKMLVPAACMIVTALLLSPAFGLVAPGPVQFVLIAAGGFMMTAASGAISSVAIDVIHLHARHAEADSHVHGRAVLLGRESASVEVDEAAGGL